MGIYDRSKVRDRLSIPPTKLSKKMTQEPYTLCKCGSGKKYKFCCWLKEK